MLILSKPKITWNNVIYGKPKCKTFKLNHYVQTSPTIPSNVIILSQCPNACAHMVNDCYNFHSNLTEPKVKMRLYNGLYLFSGVKIWSCICYQNSVVVAWGGMPFYKCTADGKKQVLWISVLKWGMRSLVSILITMGKVLGEVGSSLSGFGVKQSTYKLLQHGDLG